MDRWVRLENIARFRRMLQQQMDPGRRREIEQLLTEEEQKLRELDREN